MVHKGKFAEQFFNRDLCGEMPQNQAFSSPKYWAWRNPGATGTIADWVHTNHPVSDEGERVDGEQHIRWSTSFDPPGHAGSTIDLDLEWFPNTRLMRLDVDVFFGTGAAHAYREVSQVGTSSYFLFNNSTPWSGATTTNPSAWTWGTGAIARTFLLVRQGYPWPP